MSKEDPIVGSGGANKPPERNEGDAESPLPEPAGKAERDGVTTKDQDGSDND
jgi:hypothetical protein